MDWNRVEGNWKEVKGKIKEKWGKLTDDDLNVINGKRTSLKSESSSATGMRRTRLRMMWMTGTIRRGGNRQEARQPGPFSVVSSAPEAQMGMRGCRLFCCAAYGHTGGR